MKRYSNIPLPSFRYIPGKNSRPAEAWMPNTKVEHSDQSLERLKYALDLIHHHYYWEAHEALENLWNFHGRNSTPAGQFLQCLLLWAVYNLKWVYQERTTKLTAEKLRSKLNALQTSSTFGIEHKSLLKALENRSDDDFIIVLTAPCKIIQ
jgi:hypothetical protein